jgi:hypothetical protein
MSVAVIVRRAKVPQDFLSLLTGLSAIYDPASVSVGTV